jgi:hypothetical protein
VAPLCLAALNVLWSDSSARHRNDLSALRTAGLNRSAAPKPKWPKRRAPTASAPPKRSVHKRSWGAVCAALEQPTAPHHRPSEPWPHSGLNLRSACPREPPSHNSNCFGCLRNGGGDDDSDAIATSDDSAPATLHAQPKALRNNAAPTGEGVLIPPHAGHTSHATCACALSRTLEQTCEAAALLRSFSAAQPL